MPYDDVIAKIAAYACEDGNQLSDEARQNAMLCLKDSIGCALRANSVEDCLKVMQVWDGELDGSYGVRVPGLRQRMPVAQAAAAITTAVRWLDFNDTWLAKEWGHPSDNIGTVLAVADHLGKEGSGDGAMTVSDALDWMIKAYEIQGVLALENAFNRVGIDHVLLVKVASTAVAAAMLSGRNEKVVSAAVSHAWLDATLRTYRHGSTTGSRKSWAAGDAVERAVKFAMLANSGVDGCQEALTATGWGFQDVWFGGREVLLDYDLGCYVMENVLFKVRYPAEFHGQTAIEAAITLQPDVVGRLSEVREVRIRTQEAAMRIIDKQGQLHNEADRDHCIQYMTAVALLNGDVKSEDYEDGAAADPRIDELREKMVVAEDQDYTRDYLNPDSRSIANSVQVVFNDGTSTNAVEVWYPLGHRKRRKEAIPWLARKFEENVRHTYWNGDYASKVLDTFSDLDALLDQPVGEFMHWL